MHILPLKSARTRNAPTTTACSVAAPHAKRTKRTAASASVRKKEPLSLMTEEYNAWTVMPMEVGISYPVLSSKFWVLKANLGMYTSGLLFSLYSLEYIYFSFVYLLILQP